MSAVAANRANEDAPKSPKLRLLRAAGKEERFRFVWIKTPFPRTFDRIKLPSIPKKYFRGQKTIEKEEELRSEK